MRRLCCILAGVLLLPGCRSNPVAESGPRSTNKVAEINTQLGIEYMKQGQYETALKKLKKAVDADPGYADAYNVLGLVYGRLGDEAQAEAAYRKAVSLAPKDSSALNNYGQFLCSHGRAEEAQEMFARAVENPLYPTPEIAYANAGVCAMEQQKDLALAEKRFREALAKNPKMASALLQMARLSYEQGRFLQARGYLQRYAEVAQHTPQSLWLGIEIERKLGDKDAEASYAMTLKGKFPSSAEAGRLREEGR